MKREEKKQPLKSGDEMKEKILEAAGKTWQLLAQRGETNIDTLPKLLNQKNDIVNQSLGWLAREEKINFVTREDKTFVSLSEKETLIVNSVTQKIQLTAATKNKSTK